MKEKCLENEISLVYLCGLFKILTVLRSPTLAATSSASVDLSGKLLKMLSLLRTLMNRDEHKYIIGSHA